jgi:hypothetical protein
VDITKAVYSGDAMTAEVSGAYYRSTPTEISFVFMKWQIMFIMDSILAASNHHGVFWRGHLVGSGGNAIN